MLRMEVNGVRGMIWRKWKCFGIAVEKNRKEKRLRPRENIAVLCIQIII